MMSFINTLLIFETINCFQFALKSAELHVSFLNQISTAENIKWTRQNSTQLSLGKTHVREYVRQFHTTQ